MKKILFAVSAIALIIIAALYINSAVKKSGKAYSLAKDLISAGLPADEIRPKENSGMYSEVLVLGENLNVKVSSYGNGLFMDNIIKNLEAEKTKKSEPGIYKPAILVSGLFIMVVYAEPEPGLVKKIFAEKSGTVREY